VPESLSSIIKKSMTTLDIIKDKILDHIFNHRDCEFLDSTGFAKISNSPLYKFFNTRYLKVSDISKILDKKLKIANEKFEVSRSPDKTKQVKFDRRPDISTESNTKKQTKNTKYDKKTRHRRDYERSPSSSPSPRVKIKSNTTHITIQKRIKRSSYRRDSHKRSYKMNKYHKRNRYY
jgi:hypothetical protein